MEYLYVKALHIIFVTTWFAGLFYVVRLFIYHTESLSKSDPDKTILSDQFILMSSRLWYIIAWPSAIITIILGVILLYLNPTWLKEYFIHVKLAFVFVLLIYHLICHRIYKKLKQKHIVYTPMQLRMFNEIATLLLIIIVFIIVLKNDMNWIWVTVSLIVFTVFLMLVVRIYKKLRINE